MTTDVEALRTRLRSAAELAQNRHILIEAAEALRSQAERIQALEAKCALLAASLAQEEAKCAELERDAAWRPIETAPRDARTILLTNGDVVSAGHWLHEDAYVREKRDLDGRYIGQDEFDGFDGWVDWDGGMDPEPTHWMPLPAAPIAAQAGSKETDK